MLFRSLRISRRHCCFLLIYKLFYNICFLFSLISYILVTENRPAVPEGRVKPWGTGHAVRSCRNLLNGPFVVINADDYYGRSAFEQLYGYLNAHEDGEKYFIIYAFFSPSYPIYL